MQREQIILTGRNERTLSRPTASGKLLVAGGRPLFVRGVTYGPFRPDPRTSEEFGLERAAADFAAMAQAGIDAVRVYTGPPAWMLDLAAAAGLRVMVGVPWEQHVTFLDAARRRRSIERRVRETARACAGHPALLGVAVGNEIPASIVRYYGRRRIERFLGRLAGIVREEDEGALVTYANYPTTEYLELPFLDFLCFNVYLEQQDALARYVARLQNLAADRPLVLAELGLDAARNGDLVQAASLRRQLETAFAGGAAGAFVFSWTDEWFRGGVEVEGWSFGLTTKDRRPRPALAAVGEVYRAAPLAGSRHWPKVSVVVCSYNGEATIGQCLDGIARLDYPDFEVIVIDDGSRDRTAAIARRPGVRVVSTSNRGLSSARNLGLELASGRVIAYIDDDAWPDPLWLRYVVAGLEDGDHAAIGGPNLPPAGDGRIADCVAASPGGPTHVLLDDRVAEHVPGCNIAFRTGCLRMIGGFDPRFRIAGDDVDVCWRLQARGWTIGFSPAAQVWHHRRNRVRAYLRQQWNYGRAEAILERRWPERFNALGHARWSGRVYQAPRLAAFRAFRQRIYYGPGGSAPFQSVYERATGFWSSLPRMPEWYALLLVLGVAAALSLVWPPLAFAGGLFALLAAFTIGDAALKAGRVLRHARLPRRERLVRLAIVTFLNLAQPVARLLGRLDRGLTPLRRRARGRPALPYRRTYALWSERWRAPETWLAAIEHRLIEKGAAVRRGGAYDRWDLEVRIGILGFARVAMAIEEHGSGRQMVKVRAGPAALPAAVGLGLALVALGLRLLGGEGGPGGILLVLGAAVFLATVLWQSAIALGTVRATLGTMMPPSPGRRAGRPPAFVRALPSRRVQRSW